MCILRAWNVTGFIKVIILLLFCSCNLEKDDVSPVAEFRVDPTYGFTTDSFSFDASYSNPGRQDDKTYYRWDWDNDGVWDGEYSRISLVHHRFYSPGSHLTKMEVINSSGLVDTAIIEIMVEQGYSAPHAEFTIIPQEGNFKTEYTFDGSSTRDDEDSLMTLKFRWDFGDTDYWDVGFKTDPIARHFYADTGRYTVRMEVKDPSNKINAKEAEIQVTNLNTLLVADFEWFPKYGTTMDTFLFDASRSNYLGDNKGVYGYSWKFPPKYEWSDWTTEPKITLRFGREVDYELELRVKDADGLVNYAKKLIQIYHENLPPNPKFRIGCSRGNVRTQFYFDSWPTLDIESLPTSLQVRWDFDGDGSFETDYTYDRETYRQYPKPGRYKITMEAIDPDGLSDTVSHYIDVSPWENETGLIKDHRDGQYYGTVKIGDQWWMSENLNFDPTDWQKDEVRKYCYSRYWRDPVKWCDVYGGLYNVYHATRNDVYGDVEGICPKGWHMPSKQEWEQMIDYIGGYNQAQKLLLGRETDFNALMGGYGINKWDSEENCYMMNYKWRDYATYFWSFTPLRGEIFATSSWNVTLFKDQDKIYPGYSSNEMFFYVRCVKDE